jgi:uncharacterized protein (TIGR02757 family)
MKRTSLKRTLDTLYEGYDFKDRAKHDPISIPMRYSTKEDREVMGFIATAFAYGKVTLFLPVLEALAEVLGPRPARYLRDSFTPQKDLKKLTGIKYRFYSSHDVTAALYVISQALKREGSLEAIFMKYYRPDEQINIGAALGGFMNELYSTATIAVYGTDEKPAGFRHFFPSPRPGACKRGALFMRWMVRSTDIDFGLWKEVSPTMLVIPLDTHIARVSRCLGLTSRKTNGWATAVEITESLKRLEPNDPLKYDFALCHRGISGVCTPDSCDTCIL